MRALLIFLLLSFPLLSLAEVYKWTDANGRVHFTDQPVDNAETIELKIKELTPEEEAAAAEKRRYFKEQQRLHRTQASGAKQNSYGKYYKKRNQGNCRYYKEKLEYAHQQRQNLKLQGYTVGEKEKAEERIHNAQARVKQYCG
ncbi:MAG: DUF4124 domain-containing protein [Pseudomonadales bacterium]